VKQNEAATQNAIRRDLKRKEVEFKIGEYVFYWMDKSSEKVSETDIGRISIPAKWRSWWQGPFEVIHKKNSNVYEILVDGKPVTANVNRLTPHDCWSETLKDTNSFSWLDGPLSHLDKSQNFISQSKGPTKEIKIGTMVVWAQKPSESAKSPFGIGKVLSKRLEPSTGREMLVCQWYGNTHDKINSTYRPCWFQKSTSQIYFSAARHHATHPEDTTDDYGTVIYSDSVVLQQFQIRDDDRLSPEEMSKISEHEAVKENWPGDQ
jgi:hypothetical protein